MLDDISTKVLSQCIATAKSPVMLFFVFLAFAAGADRWQNGSDVIVDYNTSDPLIRWDSYQNICDGEGTVTSAHDSQ